jgi:outer membrane biosynthesis protein TonB
MPMQTGDRFNPLEMQNSGARVPALRLTKSNPKAAALMSKLVSDQRVQRTTDAMNEQGTGMNLAGMRSIAHEGMQNVNDSETIRQLLSDTDLAAAILVSVILSPKDMVGIEVGYKSELTRWSLPHEVNNTLTNAVRKYFDEVYKIKPRLPTMLEDILFKRGCYPVVVMPENAVDDLIHGNGSVSMESIAAVLKKDGQIQSLGILGPTDTEKATTEASAKRGYGGGIGLALEHLLTHNPNKNWNSEVTFRFPEAKDVNHRSLNPGITVTDNISILKMPMVSEKIRQQKIHKLVGRTSSLSAESIARRVGNPADMTANLHNNALLGRTFHKPNTSQVVVKEVKSQDKLKRRSVGMPLEIHFPSESVIPVHVPNQPHKQIGFFILLDAEGNPINRGMGINHYRQLGASLQSNSFSSSMIQRAGLAMSDNSNLYNQGNGYATAAQLYGNMLERDLVERLRNGLVGNNVSIAGHEEIYSLMMARSMANQHTQILYVPVEYMTYMAFEYNPNGTGRSLLENTKIIDSMQANMLVGTVMGALRNAVGRTHVDIELDEHTPDPWKAIEQTVGEMQRINSNGFPLGTIDPLDIKDGLQRSQFEFSFSGHPKLPNMKVEYSEKNSNYQPPDSKLMEDLRKRRLMSFWLTPEMVDAAVGADFAASVANNSTLLSKRAMMIQQEFTPQVSAHLRKHAINSADLIDELVEIILGSFTEILKEFKDDEEIEMSGGEVVTKQELQDNALIKAQFIREMIEDFIGGFSMTLPEPDTTKVENLGELYSKQSSFVEEALKAWISDDMMDDSIVGPEMASHVRVAAAQMKAYMLRDWQMKNGMLPELAALTALGEDGEIEVDLAEITAVHNEAIIGLLTTLITANKKAKEKAAKALEKAGVETSSDGSYSGGDSSGGDGGGFGDDGGSGDGGFDMGGGMDFGMGDMGGETGETGEETTDTEPEETDTDATTEETPEEEPATDEEPEDTDDTAAKEDEAKAEEDKAAEEEEAKKQEEEEAKKKEEEEKAKADAAKTDDNAET